jgi:hypothetical protein
MPDDRNSKLAALLAEAVDDTPDDDEALCRRREASPPPRPLCPDCNDVAGDGINCPVCQAIRAARHQRTPDEQAAYDKAKQTRPIDATPVRDWRRHKPLTSGERPGDNVGEPCAGSIESMRPPIQAGEGGANPTPALHEDTKGIDMAARLPKTKMPPLMAGTPPRVGAKRCENPRSNPKCSGTTTKQFCRSCGILESRIARGFVDGDAVPPAAPPQEQPERVDAKTAVRPAVARHVVSDADGSAVHVVINARAARVVLEVLDNLAAKWMGQVAGAEKSDDPEADLIRVREAYYMGLVAGSIRVGLAT